MYITCGSDRRVEGAVSNELHNSDDQFTLILVDEGTFGTCGDDKFTIPNHSLLYVRPDENVKIESRRIKVFYFSPKFLNLNYTFSEIERIQNKTEIAEYEGELCFKMKAFYDRSEYPFGIVRLPQNKYNAVCKLYDDIAHNFVDQPDGYWSCRARTALGHILTIASGLTGEFPDDQKMSAVIDYIQGNYRRKITEDQITDISGMDMERINGKMIDVYGVTFSRYLSDMRIDLACMSLAYTELPIAEIVSRCGFYDQSHLSKVMKEYKGMSPLQYRKHAQESRKAFYRDRTT